MLGEIFAKMCNVQLQGDDRVRAGGASWEKLQEVKL